jgi:mono/diheme cytochrome c family protein
MPRNLIYILLTVVILAMIPPAVIARKRVLTTEQRRIHFIQDMDNQHKFRAQQVNPLFADGRAMRQPVAGTVAWGELNEDDHFHRGLSKKKWATSLPSKITVDMALLNRGQQRFNIYCQPCHGLAGYGDGIVNTRAMDLLNSGTNGTTWVAPKSLHEKAIREQPVGQIFNTITNGVRNMAGYGAQIPTDDRWAIVAYVRALQRSQNAKIADVPPDQRTDLPTVRIETVVEDNTPVPVVDEEKSK